MGQQGLGAFENFEREQDAEQKQILNKYIFLRMGNVCGALPQTSFSGENLAAVRVLKSVK